MTYRDSHGKRLDDYPRPSVAVDTAVLTITSDNRLSVLLVEGPGGRRLPGTFLHSGETLADAVLRSLDEKAGVRGLRPRQLSVFDEPDRDPRGWVLSVAHLDAVPFQQLTLDTGRGEFVPVVDVGPLLYQHGGIVDSAVARLRADYLQEPDPAKFLREPFTLRELRQCHQSVLGLELTRDSFRRSMEPLLQATGEIERGSVGKPARTFLRPQTPNVR